MARYGNNKPYMWFNSGVNAWRHNLYSLPIECRNWFQHLSQFVNSLLDKNMANSNPYSKWTSASLCLPKPSPPIFRFTVDLQAINKFTIEHAYLMPNLKQELHKMSRSTSHTNFDLLHAYWQLPLHENSQELQCFTTHDGVYSPTRVFHGTPNDVARRKSALSAIFLPKPGENRLSLLEYLLLHLRSLKSYLKLSIIFIPYVWNTESNFILRNAYYLPSK